MPKTSAAQGWSKKCVEHDSGKKLRWLQQWHEFKKYFPISRANASKAYTRVSQLGPSVPLGGHGAILRAPWSEGFTKWLCRDIAKSYWWAGGHKCWEFLEGGHKQWKVEKHWSKPTYAKQRWKRIKRYILIRTHCKPGSCVSFIIKVWKQMLWKDELLKVSPHHKLFSQYCHFWLSTEGSKFW